MANSPRQTQCPGPKGRGWSRDKPRLHSLMFLAEAPKRFITRVSDWIALSVFTFVHRDATRPGLKMWLDQWRYGVSMYLLYRAFGCKTPKRYYPGGDHGDSSCSILDFTRQAIFDRQPPEFPLPRAANVPGLPIVNERAVRLLVLYHQAKALLAGDRLTRLQIGVGVPNPDIPWGTHAIAPRITVYGG